MRDILFKAKRIDNGEWVEGAYFPKTKYPMKKNRAFIWVWQIGKFYCDYNCGYLPYEVDEKTICQYTGMTDRNGKKIFEGDVVVDGVRRELCLVIFDEDKACFQLCSKFDIYDVGDFNYDTDVKVIGNILDTPELMKIAFYNGIFRIRGKQYGI